MHLCVGIEVDLYKQLSGQQALQLQLGAHAGLHQIVNAVVISYNFV